MSGKAPSEILVQRRGRRGGVGEALLCFAVWLRVISVQCSPGISQAALCLGVGPAALE